MIDLQSKITSTPENLLIIVSRIHIANQETIFKKKSKKLNDLLNSFMMKQATPHLGGVWSSLMSNESSNRGGQSKKNTYIRAED
jgi:hypothetical protein